MSNTAIGKAALVLSTSAAGLRSGLASAGSDATRWAGDTAKSIDAKLKGAGKVAGRGLSDGLFAGGAARLAGATGAAIAGVVGVRQALQTLDDVARGGAAAKAFGLTAEQFTGMAGVAASVGEGQREFIESLVTLGKVASEGAAGKGEVATAWFKSLNLDAKQFKALRLDEQFFKVFETIKAAGNKIDPVRSLMVAFGEDGGKYLLPLLAKTPEELRKMAAGLAITTDEVQKASAANQQLVQAGNTLKASWRSFVVSMAPVVKTVAEVVEKLRPVLDMLGKIAPILLVGKAIGPAFRAVGGVLGTVLSPMSSIVGLLGKVFSKSSVVLVLVGALASALSDVLGPILDAIGEVFATVGEIAAAVFREVVDVVRSVVGAVAEWVGATLGLGDTTWSVRDVIIGAFRAIGTAGMYVWDTIKVGLGGVAVGISYVVDGFGVLVSAFGDVVSLAKELPDKIRPDWVDDMVSGIDRFAGKVHGAGDSLRTWGKEAIDGFGNSAVRFNGWLDGIANRTKEQAKEAVKETVAAAAQMAEAAQLKNLDNAALIKGSAAEVSARVKHDFGGKIATEKLLEEQKKGNKHLGDISKKLDRKPQREEVGSI